MGYRGSKSNMNKIFVKEQRVDGSCIGNYTLNNKFPMLRCTLMNFERGYRIRILSKVLHKKGFRFYSTLNRLKNEITLNPWFLTGFIDGEGCFRISLTKVNRALG